MAEKGWSWRNYIITYGHNDAELFVALTGTCIHRADETKKLYLRSRFCIGPKTYGSLQPIIESEII